jgi:hypothetical protein
MYPFALKQDSAAHDYMNDKLGAALIVEQTTKKTDSPRAINRKNLTRLTAFARTSSDDMADSRRIRCITCATTLERLAHSHVLTRLQVTRRWEHRLSHVLVYQAGHYNHARYHGYCH